MSKVPNWGFSGAHPLDFIGMRFRASLSVLAGKKSREINGQIWKTAQLPSNARPGRFGRTPSMDRRFLNAWGCYTSASSASGESLPAIGSSSSNC
jgi:hypothetical protein